MSAFKMRLDTILYHFGGFCIWQLCLVVLFDSCIWHLYLAVNRTTVEPDRIRQRNPITSKSNAVTLNKQLVQDGFRRKGLGICRQQ